MEKQSTQTDFKMNQEKLLVAKDEYRRLCYEMKKKEINRNSTHAKMQQHIRQQWDTVSELKKKKSELTLLLRLQESESFSNRANQNLSRFKKVLKEVIRLEGLLKKQGEELEKYNRDIAVLDKKVRQKQKDVVKAQRNKGRTLKHQKDISFLENRLNGSLNKYNQLHVTNSTLREDISSLLLTQSAFRRKFSHIKRLLLMGYKTLAETVHSATVTYQTGESVKYKLNLINERTQVDQKKLGEKVKELKILVEQDQQMKEFLEFKSRDRSASGDAEKSDTQSNQILEQRLQTYHAILSRIQMASGCHGDVNRICKVFVQQEENNLTLFERVNELSGEVERLHAEVREERHQLEILTRQSKEQKKMDSAVKSGIEKTTDKLRTEAQRLEDAADSKGEELESIKAVLHRIYGFLEGVSPCQVSFAVDEGITDDNILQYLEVLEERVSNLIQCYRVALVEKHTLHEKKDHIFKESIMSFGSKYSLCESSNSNSSIERKVPELNISFNKKSLESFARMFSHELHPSSPHS